MAAVPDTPRVASPCTGVCRMDPATSWCVGCRRTIDEIVAWASLDDPARRAIRIALKQRRSTAPGTIPSTTAAAPGDSTR